MSSEGWHRRPLLGPLLLGVACGGADKADSGAVPLADLDGVRVVFDPTADTSVPERFFDQPWPLDLRRGPDGRPDLTGIPAGDTAPAQQLLSLMAEATDFSQVPTVVFRFEAPVAARGLSDGPAARSEAVFLDVDPGSPGYGTVVPAFLGTPPPDPYTPDHALVVQPVHGFVLSPATTWAVVVSRTVA